MCTLLLMSCELLSDISSNAKTPAVTLLSLNTLRGAHQALPWQLITKKRKRRLALHTALRTVYQRRQLLLRVACLTVLLLANNNGAAVLRLSCRPSHAMLLCFPTYGPLTARNGDFKDI